MKNRAEINQQRLALEEVAAQREELEDGIAFQQAKTRADFAAARRQLAAAREQRRAARAALAHVQKRYRLGAANYLDFTRARERVTQAELAIARQWAKLHHLKFYWQWAAGYGPERQPESLRPEPRVLPAFNSDQD
jgi:outer membrane protein TolC